MSHHCRQSRVREMTRPVKEVVPAHATGGHFDKHLVGGRCWRRYVPAHENVRATKFWQQLGSH